MKSRVGSPPPHVIARMTERCLLLPVGKDVGPRVGVLWGHDGGTSDTAVGPFHVPRGGRGPTCWGWCWAFGTACGRGVGSGLMSGDLIRERNVKVILKCYFMSSCDPVLSMLTGRLQRRGLAWHPAHGPRTSESGQQIRLSARTGCLKPDVVGALHAWEEARARVRVRVRARYGYD